MTDYVSRAKALTVACPLCEAEAGEACLGSRAQPRTSVHHDRMTAFMRDHREPRFYDLEQNYIPPGHDESPPARDPSRISDEDRVLGLAHCHQILEQLAARGLATGKATQ